MADEGAAIVVNDTVPGSAESTVREIVAKGGLAVPFTSDITSFDEARKLIQTAVSQFGSVDILVNNAGVFASAKAWEMSEADWDRCIAVSLKGAFNCTRNACGIMKEKGWGRIINATSPARMGQPEAGAYAAAKAGLVGYTISLAMELGKYGITSNAYSPMARTTMAFSQEALERHKRRYEGGWVTRETYEKMLNPPPPEAMAPLIVYLATDEAGGINGQVFDIRGDSISVHDGTPQKTTIRKASGFWTEGELAQAIPREMKDAFRIAIP
jgi:3-oxoacyl-[acyl-carrier protein] reductase